MTQIPIAEIYRDVGIHDNQPRDRVDEVVKPAIDRVLAMHDLGDLWNYCADIREAPEARLLAAAMCEAAVKIAVDEHVKRPEIDLEKIRAAVAGLSSLKWRSPVFYGSDLDTPGGPGPDGRRHVPRETPLPDDVYARETHDAGGE